MTSSACPSTRLACKLTSIPQIIEGESKRRLEKRRGWYTHSVCTLHRASDSVFLAAHLVLAMLLEGQLTVASVRAAHIPTSCMTSHRKTTQAPACVIRHSAYTPSCGALSSPAVSSTASESASRSVRTCSRQTEHGARPRRADTCRRPGKTSSPCSKPRAMSSPQCPGAERVSVLQTNVKVNCVLTRAGGHHQLRPVCREMLGEGNTTEGESCRESM